MEIGIPGQPITLQLSLSFRLQIQSFPPCFGSVQFLILVLFPTPHVTEQGLHEPQLRHFPSTKKKKRKCIRILQSLNPNEVLHKEHFGEKTSYTKLLFMLFSSCLHTTYIVSIPGQCPAKHGMACSNDAALKHGSPPCCGAGLSQALVLDTVPFPQETLHCVHCPQPPQSPSTAKNVHDKVITTVL